jgi:hypothetical protein
MDQRIDENEVLSFMQENVRSGLNQVLYPIIYLGMVITDDRINCDNPGKINKYGAIKQQYSTRRNIKTHQHI